MSQAESPRILCIETSTQICSVAIVASGEVASLVESYVRYRHGEWLTIAIDNAVRAAAINKSDIQAVSVTIGPGSYTGLRIGLATAKAICMALNIPLITHSTLKILASGIRSSFPEYDYIIPMIDARRMEVYSAVFNHNLQRITEDSPLILNEEICNDLLEKYKSFVIGGDGAEKSRPLWKEKKNVRYAFSEISSKFQATEALQKFSEKNFQDIAYVLPIYLKNPNITQSSRTL